MKAVILIAGQSTRTYPLTKTRPKPLLPFFNKPILEHTLEQLPDAISEIILVVSYKKEMIKKKFGNKWNNKPIHYVDQKEPKGTGHALAVVESHINDRFLLILGDNVYSKQDLNECIKHPCSILTAKVDHPEHFGVITEYMGKVSKIVEKPTTFISDQAAAGAYVLPVEVFQHVHSLPKTLRGEYELPDAFLPFLHTMKVVHATQHYFIGYPWDLVHAHQTKENIIGDKTLVKGEVLHSTIGDNCKIYGKVVNSVIMNNTIVEENSVVEHSILGESVVFDGACRAASTTSMIKGNPVETGLFGTAVGDNVQATEINIHPGCKINPNQHIQGEIKEDK